MKKANVVPESSHLKENDPRFKSVADLCKDEQCKIKDAISKRGKYACQIAGCPKETKMYCGKCAHQNWSSIEDLKALMFCPDHRKDHVCSEKEVLEKCQECFDYSVTVQSRLGVSYCGTCYKFVQEIPNNEESDSKEDEKMSETSEKDSTTEEVVQGGTGRGGTVRGGAVRGGAV